MRDAWTREGTFSNVAETKWRDVIFSSRFRFIADIFHALSAVFLFGQALVCFVLVGCSLFCRLFDFREFNYANFNSNGKEYNGCGYYSRVARMFSRTIRLYCFLSFRFKTKENLGCGDVFFDILITSKGASVSRYI